MMQEIFNPPSLPPLTRTKMYQQSITTNMEQSMFRKPPSESLTFMVQDIYRSPPEESKTYMMQSMYNRSNPQNNMSQMNPDMWAPNPPPNSPNKSKSRDLQGIQKYKQPNKHHQDKDQ